MGFKLKKLGTATGLGLLDLALKKIDETTGMSIAGLPMTTTLGRSALFAIGLIGDAVVSDSSKWHDYLETMYIAEEPLLIGTIAKGAGFVADYQEAPSKSAIELRLRNTGQGQTIAPGNRVQFR